MSPVFIAGCGRSGTSYLRTIVDAHPDFFIPSESLFLVDYLKMGASLPKWLLSWMFFHEPQLLCWYEHGSFPISDAREAIQQTHEFEARAHGARFWGQKTPRFINHMSLFESAFPDIRWLLVYRDPRAVAASMKMSRQHTYSVAKACRRWKRDNSPIIDLLAGQSLPSRVMLVKFEDLVLSYEQTLTSVFRFLGVEPIDGEEVSRRGRPVFFKRSRFAINTIRGDLTPDPAILQSWRRVLKPNEIAYIENACSDEMRMMGYFPVVDGVAGKVNRMQAVKDVKIFFAYLRNWPEYLLMTALRKGLMQIFAVTSMLSGRSV